MEQEFPPKQGKRRSRAFEPNSPGTLNPGLRASIFYFAHLLRANPILRFAEEGFIAIRFVRENKKESKRTLFCFLVETRGTAFCMQTPKRVLALTFFFAAVSLAQANSTP